MTDIKVDMIVKHNGYLYRVGYINKDHRSLELCLGNKFAKIVPIEEISLVKNGKNYLRKNLIIRIVSGISGVILVAPFWILAAGLVILIGWGIIYDLINNLPHFVFKEFLKVVLYVCMIVVGVMIFVGITIFGQSLIDKAKRK